MAAKRKKKDDDELGAPAYMGTYATLMTLLMAFFVVLSTMGTFGGEKFNQASASITRALSLFPEGGFGVLNQKSSDRSQMRPYFQTSGLKTLYTISGAEIEQVLKTSAAEGVQDIEVLYLKDGSILIRIPEITFFNRGTAILKPGSYSLLDALIRLCKDQPYEITIAGHTDNTFEPGPLYASNWELSAARASQVTRYLHDTGNIDDQVLHAVGYAHYRPRGDNDTEEGRLQNRRMEILLKKIEGEE